MTYGELRFDLTIRFGDRSPDRIDSALNNALSKIKGSNNWKALEADGAISTSAVVSDGTVSVVSGSPSITLTAATWDPALTGRRFRVYGRSESYIFARTGATTGTLDRPYESDTGAALSYAIYKDVYALPADYDAPGQALNERLPYELAYMDRQALDRAVPSHPLMGEPRVWTEVSRSADGTRNAQVYPIPCAAASYPLRYRRKLARVSEADASADLPDWIRPDVVIAYASYDLAGGSGDLAMFNQGVSEMRREDSEARGPQALRMAKVFTAHRIKRWRR